MEKTNAPTVLSAATWDDPKVSGLRDQVIKVNAGGYVTLDGSLFILIKSEVPWPTAK